MLTNRFGGFVYLTLAVIASRAVGGDCRWMPFAPVLGDNSEVQALASYDDGSGMSLYAGGRFPGGVVKWTGQEWSPLGLSGEATALAVHDDGSGPALYAAGQISAGEALGLPYRVLRWDGQSWGVVGEPANGPIYGLASHNDDGSPKLVVLGEFSQIGAAAAASIAMWDGQTWAALGDGLNGNAQAATSFDDGSGPALFVGGFFTEAGGVTVNRVAKWDGDGWSALGSGVDSLVNGLAVHDDGSGEALYAGGFFTVAGGSQASLVARWDGSSWTPVGEGLGPAGPSVIGFITHDDGRGPKLYAGGAFTETGSGSPAAGIAVWDGTAWSGLGSGVSGGNMLSAVNAFVSGVGTDAQTLIVGGRFSEAGGLPTGSTAQWVPCRADLDDNCRFDFFDISAFTLLYLLGDPQADFTGDGRLNFFDFAEFLDEFSVGCG